METSIQKNFTIYTIYLHDITRHTRYIYTRRREKICYLSNLFSRNVYNLEGISPAFKNPSHFEGCGQDRGCCTHHGFRTSVESHCVLRNAYKLKRWLTKYEIAAIQVTIVPQKIEARATSRAKRQIVGIFQFNLKIGNTIIRNIEAWRKNISTKKINQSENKQATNEEKKDLPKFDSLTTIGRDKANTSVSHHQAFLRAHIAHIGKRGTFEFT